MLEEIDGKSSPFRRRIESIFMTIPAPAEGRNLAAEGGDAEADPAQIPLEKQIIDLSTDPSSSAKERAKAQEFLRTTANADDVQAFMAQRAKLASERDYVDKQIQFPKDQSEKLTAAQTEFQRRKSQHYRAAAQDKANHRSLAADFARIDLICRLGSRSSVHTKT